MACDRIDPSEQIPEADLLGQPASLDATLIDDEQQALSSETAGDRIEAGGRWELQAPPPHADDHAPHNRAEAGRARMADPLVDVAVRVYAEFADRVTLAEVLAVVARCRNDLDTPSAAALPELVERLARQRLGGRVKAAGIRTAPTPDEPGIHPRP